MSSALDAGVVVVYKYSPICQWSAGSNCDESYHLCQLQYRLYCPREWCTCRHPGAETDTIAYMSVAPQVSRSSSCRVYRRRSKLLLCICYEVGDGVFSMKAIDAPN